MNEIARLEKLRDELPDRVAETCRMVADNPGQVAFALSMEWCILESLHNLVKPRGFAGNLAVAVTGGYASVLLITLAVKRGYITLYQRDGDGNRVPVKPKPGMFTGALGKV